MVRLISYHLTWNWTAEIQREAARMSHPDLANLFEEIMPFTSDLMFKTIPVVDDDDLKEWGQYSEESLVDRYRKSADKIKEASPPLPEGFESKISPDLKEYIEKRDGLFSSDSPLLGEQMASNNWVVHGNHTETGMPLFASDPHLNNGIPSAWLLYNLRLPNGKILAGGQLPGVPMISIGRSNNITWGCTTSRADNADLWQEKLNEDETKYFVDGEWRELKIN